MAGIKGNDLKRSGFEQQEILRSALPMVVWSLDLEVEIQRVVSAAELAVLKLVAEKISGVLELSLTLGLGDDTRLAEDTLVRLLAQGALERDESVLRVTELGRRWIAEGQSRQREWVTCEVKHDPTQDSIDWYKGERSMSGGREVWTIDLPYIEDGRLTGRIHELARLVREEGLPDREERGPAQERPPVELVHASIQGRRVHHQEVEVQRWVRSVSGETQLIGHIGGAEHPGLTALLSKMELVRERKRLVGVETTTNNNFGVLRPSR